MRKVLLTLSLCIMTVITSACSVPYIRPIGTWKSDDPDITITFPEISNEESPDIGTIDINDKMEQVIFLFGYDPVVEIFPLSAYHDDGIYDDDCYFKGGISWDSDNLILYISQSTLDDISEGSTIVFSPQEGASTSQ